MYTLALIRYFIKGTLVGIRVNDPDFQQKSLMETSIRMVFLSIIVPTGSFHLLAVM